MPITSEPVLGLAVMQALATAPDGESEVQTIIKAVPAYLNLTAEDREISVTRPPEEMWEQRVRNLKSHDTRSGNVIAEGFVEHTGRGRYKLTAAGRLHLEHKGLV